ncbi:hypothetical protein MHYP_G00044070 [Metynnis hypsauchen]
MSRRLTKRFSFEEVLVQVFGHDEECTEVEPEIEDTRHVRWRNDKLAAIRKIWDMWVERLPLMYNPGPEVTVDKRLVPFRGLCSFKVYIPSKPGKYGIKIWAACDARSSYAWNM